MSRTTRPGAANPRSARPWEPSGAAWDALRAHLWARWRAIPGGPRCYHCNCAGPDQIEHLISPQKRPDLAMAEENLRPTHGKCPPPPDGCGLSCNNLSAGNAAPRDSLGRSLPFPPEFKARKMAEAAAKASRGVRSRRELPPSGRRRESAAAKPAERAGREWLRSLPA